MAISFQLRDVVSFAIAYAIVHIIALCFYRSTLHPYAKYPGPFLAKLTTLYATYYAYTGDMHLDIERCHRKYGKFVRYSPNGLLVNSSTGFHDIYGNLKKTKKSKSYVVHGITNLIGIQDKKDYARSKKIFQIGFSDAAIREHEPKVIQEINTFIDKISENETPDQKSGSWTNEKNMTLWANYLTTDVVSKVVFTTSWDLLSSTANRGVTETFKQVVHLIGVLHQTPLLYLHPYLAIIFLPKLTRCITALKKYTSDVIDSSRKAREKDPSIKDVFGQFTSARDPDTGELALAPIDVRRNSSNFIIAGSDTTASAIAATFFYLSRNLSAYAKVAQEVRSTFPSASSIRAGPTLNGCIYLRAAINEALRLSPVVSQPLWRETEPGGCVVDGEFIPGGLNVGAGIYSLHHNDTVFWSPYKYQIERWIPERNDSFREKSFKEFGKNFAPFSVGPRQCIAKNFAIMELMLTMAHVFWKLDFEAVGTLGEGKKGMGKGRERAEEFQLKSFFTSHMEGPMIRFKKRYIENVSEDQGNDQGRPS